MGTILSTEQSSATKEEYQNEQKQGKSGDRSNNPTNYF
jgi:hypothetical protein